jgi:hypothetical protein
VVIVIIGAILAVQFVPYAYNPYNGSIVQHWRLTLTFHDARTGKNLTLPEDIGVQGGLWYNHTLDFLGPKGYSPISTRDTSNTIYIESNRLAVFTFGDFFNIWGQPFNRTCVWTYCAAPAELVVFDADNNNAYEPGELVINNVNGSAPAPGFQLSADKKISFLDTDHNGVWEPGETVVYDTNGNSTYATNDPIIYSGVSQPSLGAALTVDPRLKYADVDNNGFWDDARPAPVMSDNANNEGCLLRRYGMSDGKNWIIALNSPNLASLFGCKS